MNSDIRLSINFYTHPKTVKLIRRAGAEGIICLQKLWIWAAQNRIDGCLAGLDEEDIEIVSGWEGEVGSFIKILTALRFLDCNDGTYCLHGWEEHQEYVIQESERIKKARNAAQKRWQKEENPQNGNAQNATSMPQACSSNASSMPQACPGDAKTDFSNAPNQTKPSFNLNTYPNGYVVGDKSPTPAAAAEVSGSDALLPLAASGEEPQADGHAGALPRSQVPDCPHSAIVSLYHELLPSLPRVKVWNKEREKNLRARWRECYQRGKYRTQPEGLAYWHDLFRHVHDNCPWLTGQGEYPNGRVWMADLGWLILPKNFTKLIEGKYDRKFRAA